MKKIFLLLIIAFSLTGCALIGQQKANWDACQADPDCKKQAEAASNKGSLLGALVGVTFGGAAAGGVAGKGIGYLIGNLRGGAALLKKKREEEEKNGANTR